MAHLLVWVWPRFYAGADQTCEMFHIIRERDVGLFSLIQQVVAQIPWALSEKRTPVALFEEGCCYWTPNGYAEKETVWEYYFEPVTADYPVSRIPDQIRAEIVRKTPDPKSPGFFLDENYFVSSHFGDHAKLKGKSLRIPYTWDDPDEPLRLQTGEIIRDHVRPRQYIQIKVDGFYTRHLKGRHVIGVHVRGTDAIGNDELRAHRHGSLALEKYTSAIEALLDRNPDAGIFVATDDQASLEFLAKKFPGQVESYDSLRHTAGETSGQGPKGWIMPAYVSGDRDTAARNGEEAVIEYLLLGRCQHLVHNGSGLARTVLLAVPGLEHTNTHHANRLSAHIHTLSLRKMKRFIGDCVRYIRKVTHV